MFLLDGRYMEPIREAQRNSLNVFMGHSTGCYVKGNISTASFSQCSCQITEYKHRSRVLWPANGWLDTHSICVPSSTPFVFVPSHLQCPQSRHDAGALGKHRHTVSRVLTSRWTCDFPQLVVRAPVTSRQFILLTMQMFLGPSSVSPALTRVRRLFYSRHVLSALINIVTCTLVFSSRTSGSVICL